MKINNVEIKIEDVIAAMLLDRDSNTRTNSLFYAHILAKTRKIEDNSIPTLGVIPRVGYIELRYNKIFFNKLNFRQQVYVLCHEILHVMLRHAEREDKNVPHMLNNIAMDLAVNSILGEPPIEGVLYPLMFKFQVGLSYEEYLNLLLKKGGKGKKCNGKGAGLNGDGGRGGVEEFDEEGNINKELANGHDMRRKEAVDNNISEEIVKQAVKEAKEFAKQYGKGLLSNDIEEIIKALFTHKINWKRYLKNWIGERVFTGIEPTRTKKNRIYPHLKGIVPGTRKEYKDPVVIAIDTSGSISDRMLQEFLAEINAISYPKEIVQCDADIKDIQIIENKKIKSLKMKGRGGTSFKPVFEWAEKNKKKFLIFFTDLDGDMPETKPRNMKVLWVTNERDKKPPFGNIVFLDDED